ncbi:MAG: transposase [Deltaproteobacteria bacterium]|nr:transposase [Deltaproteobacteria bacterium]
MWMISINAVESLDLFGRVEDGRMVLNAVGQIVHRCWADIPSHFPNVVPDAVQVMPNHMHGLLVLDSCVQLEREAFGKPVRGSVSTIIRSFKSATTRAARELEGREVVLWQPGYYDRRIRDRNALERARDYIRENPRRWTEQRPPIPEPHVRVRVIEIERESPLHPWSR